MAKYILTNKAVEDLAEIWNYTFEVWSENQADKYYQLLIDSIEEISQNPTVGKTYDEVANFILGLHVGKHIIFYRSSKPKAVEILRILHQRKDLKSKFNDSAED